MKNLLPLVCAPIGRPGSSLDLATVVDIDMCHWSHYCAILACCLNHPILFDECLGHDSINVYKFNLRAAFIILMLVVESNDELISEI
jgi:hypothetical protein